MGDAQTFSWILLSISEKGSTRRQIIEAADAINHAIPTDKELHESLHWLGDQGLIRHDGTRFWLTENGGSLLARVRQGTVMKTWDGAELEIESMIQSQQRRA